MVIRYNNKYFDENDDQDEDDENYEYEHSILDTRISVLHPSFLMDFIFIYIDFGKDFCCLIY